LTFVYKANAKWAIIYLCVRGIDFASFCEFVFISKAWKKGSWLENQDHSDKTTETIVSHGTVYNTTVKRS
jgi:hypothetical protein